MTADGGKRKDCTIERGEAKYLPELAWEVYQREIKDIKPTK
jgi:hypothetical protein